LATLDVLYFQSSEAGQLSTYKRLKQPVMSSLLALFLLENIYRKGTPLYLGKQ